MSTRYLAVAGLLVAGASMLSGCVVPNKILVSHHFNSSEKSSKILILDSGQVNPSTKQKLFNVFVRLCDIDAQGNEATCQDTKVAENVIPGSVY